MFVQRLAALSVSGLKAGNPFSCLCSFSSFLHAYAGIIPIYFKHSGKCMYLETSDFANAVCGT